ncbi:MAG: OprD family porin [Candidatus Thiodiazotropha sp. (ex Cardiolucina cf. quadrata)]|nr:OprD family porin [Candidatus Thiodiazotropha sp. (ex Cardiolucina cf. quadrata)]
MKLIHRTPKLVATGLLACGLIANALAADEAKLKGHKLQSKVRVVHFDREFGNEDNDRDQTALALEADYTSPQFGGVIGVGVSGYFVEDINDGGLAREDVLTLEDGEVDGFALFGQAYLNLTLGKSFSAKLGRQRHKSMFLNSSTSRAVPNTFQGISANFKPMKGLSFYGAIYDKWSRRTRDDFEGFATDVSDEGDIDFVSILGVKYKLGEFSINGEYLESDDFMRKFGLLATYSQKLADDSSIKYTGGVFASSDVGDLFVTRAESGDLDDEDVPGSVRGVTDSENDGLGAYIQAAWKKGNATVTGAFTIIDEIWLEDNFSGDHGRNPFPTRSRIGPDLTSTNEKVVMLKLAYNWKDYIKGLTTHVAIGHGWDAENSVDASLGEADEDWWEVYMRYKFPFLKGLQFTGRYHDYKSDETGTVDNVKDDRRDIRLYLDYVYTFK